MTLNKNTHCGFIAIVGRPNVGKSTLMNHLIGQKLSITSRKPQTTQYKINGILTQENYQYVFVDTPGFQKRYVNKLNQRLNQNVIDALNGVDIILFIVEAGIFNEADLLVLNLLPQNAKIILIINKKDKVKSKIEMDQFVNEISTRRTFNKVCLTSAKHHLGLEGILDAIKSDLPQGPFLYPDDQLTDRPNRFLAAEIIREKLFRHLGQELPYSLTVEIEGFKSEKGLNKIEAIILVDKDNQKPMVIGQNGEKLKKIASEARIDMEKLFATKVFLQIWVKVKSGFLHDAKFLEKFT